MTVAPHTKANVARQARTAELLDVVHGHCEAGPQAGPPVVRELP
ncbi:hypothetical protein [Streptomyces shenzhenensis]|nr:hypothetical protein [Streptomyces shenzhenensis]